MTHFQGFQGPQRLRRCLAGAALLGTLALPVFAQPAAPAAGPGADTPRAQRMHDRQERREQHFAQRAAALKEALKLTPEQEPAWQDFMNAMQHKPQHARLDMNPDEFAKLSTPERLDRTARAAHPAHRRDGPARRSHQGLLRQAQPAAAKNLRRAIHAAPRHDGLARQTPRPRRHARRPRARALNLPFSPAFLRLARPNSMGPGFFAPFCRCADSYWNPTPISLTPISPARRCAQSCAQKAHKPPLVHRPGRAGQIIRLGAQAGASRAHSVCLHPSARQISKKSTCPRKPSPSTTTTNLI